MHPGEYFFADGEIELNAGRPTARVCTWDPSVPLHMVSLTGAHDFTACGKLTTVIPSGVCRVRNLSFPCFSTKKFLCSEWRNRFSQAIGREKS